MKAQHKDMGRLRVLTHEEVIGLRSVCVKRAPEHHQGTASVAAFPWWKADNCRLLILLVEKKHAFLTFEE